MMQKLYEKYVKFILSVTPPTWWVIVRFVLHWLTIPLKLLLIGGNSFYQQVRYYRKVEERLLPELPDRDTQKRYTRLILKKLPLFRKKEDGFVVSELYVNRVPYTDLAGPTGLNHNFDHQCSRHGTYTFLMSKIGKRSEPIDRALGEHVIDGKLMRGYNAEGKQNDATVSGDMLLGYTLGAMNAVTAKVDEKLLALRGFINLAHTAGDAVIDNLNQVVTHILKNDYAMTESFYGPEDGPEKSLYDELKAKHKTAYAFKMKSARGMFQPGLETVGAQTLTILAATRASAVLGRSRGAEKAYKKLLWRFGYGLLALVPTTYIQTKRVYFNDHNCMIAAYVLTKLSPTKAGKFFWTLSMLYTWSLSRKQKNGYFTGLLLDASPWLEKYLSKQKEECKRYIYEAMPYNFSQDNGVEVPALTDAGNYYLPVPFNQMNQQEFHPDQEHKVLVKKVETPEGPEFYYTDNHLSGLGWLAHAVMLDPELVKEAYEELNPVSPAPVQPE